MNLLTHITLAGIIYNNLSVGFQLDRRSFIYGNIKPDLNSKLIKNSHILDHYLIYVSNQSNQLMNKELPMDEFSIELGQICHYVCDFFCSYHLNREIFNCYRDHFLYELRLHLAMGKTKKEKYKSLKNKIARRDVSSIILEMRKDYLSETPSYEKDIDYAISTSLWICESVSYFLSQNCLAKIKNQNTFYKSMPLAGGQI